MVKYLSNMDSKVKKKLELFFKKYKLVKYKKGEVIYRPDEEFEYISYIKKGYVRMYKMSYSTYINLAQVSHS